MMSLASHQTLSFVSPYIDTVVPIVVFHEGVQARSLIFFMLYYKDFTYRYIVLSVLILHMKYSFPDVYA